MQRESTDFLFGFSGFPSGNQRKPTDAERPFSQKMGIHYIGFLAFKTEF